MSLAQSAAGGIRWTTLSMATVTITQMIRLVVLGSILGPEAFGLMAMMLVVMGFVEIIAQAGLNESIIQYPNPTRIELSTLYWINIGLAVVLYVVLVSSSGLVALLYSTPELENLLPWVALVFLISPWGAQFKALLQKRLHFKALALIEIVSVLAGAVLTIALAVQGWGVWSLIWGFLASSLISTTLLLSVGLKLNMLPMFCFDYASVKPYLSFGLNLVGSNLLNQINSRIDQLVVGVLLGPQALGYYSMAFNLVLQPVSKINSVLTQVVFPVLVHVREDRRKMKYGYFTMLELLTSVNAPVLLGLAAVAPLLIPMVLGENWLPIVGVIQVLAPFSLIRSTGNAGGSFLMATGRADVALYWNMMLVVFIPISIYAGAELFGLMGVAWSLLCLQSILVFAWYLLIVRKFLGDCFLEFAGSIGIPVLLTMPMVFAVLYVDSSLMRLSDFTRLILEMLTAILVYGGGYMLFRRRFVKEHFRLLVGVK